jgi:hypothetical protein
MKSIKIVTWILAFALLQFLCDWLIDLKYTPSWKQFPDMVIILNWVLSFLIVIQFFKSIGSIKWYFSTLIALSVVVILATETLGNSLGSLFDDISYSEIYKTQNPTITFHIGTWGWMDDSGESIYIENEIFPTVRELTQIPLSSDSLKFEQKGQLVTFQKGAWKLVYNIDKKIVVK